MSEPTTMTDAEFLAACVSDYIKINQLPTPVPADIVELIEADARCWMDEQQPV